jgi:hypothetical protein
MNALQVIHNITSDEAARQRDVFDKRFSSNLDIIINSTEIIEIQEVIEILAYSKNNGIIELNGLKRIYMTEVKNNLILKEELSEISLNDLIELYNRVKLSQSVKRNKEILREIVSCHNKSILTLLSLPLELGEIKKFKSKRETSKHFEMALEVIISMINYSREFSLTNLGHNLIKWLPEVSKNIRDLNEARTLTIKDDQDSLI